MNDHNTLDFRRTIRNSMSTGGIPVNLYTVQKSKEKSVILTLSDVSGSVMNFSCFSLALVASLEKFFRQIHSFAFIDEVDDITGLLLRGDPLNLRRHVLEKSKVVGQRGYTNYGYSLRAFYERHRQYLTPKTTILIFGDGRNNWFEVEAGVLKEMRRQVKKIYWFNPEAEMLWGSGDSVMQVYAEVCDKAFACTNILELEQALSQI